MRMKLNITRTNIATSSATVPDHEINEALCKQIYARRGSFIARVRTDALGIR